MSVWEVVAGIVQGASGPVAQYNMESKKYKSGEHWNRLSQDNYLDALHNSLSYRVADARRAKIHPLAALGVNPSQGPSFAAGGGSGLGDVINRGLGQMFDAVDKSRLKKALLDQEQAKTENIEIDTKMKEAQLRNILSQKTIPSFQDANFFGVNADDLSRTIPSDITASDMQGHDAGVKNMAQVAIDPKGRIHETASKDMQEAVSEEIVAQVKYAGARLYDHGEGMYAFYNNNTPTAKAFEKRMIADLGRIRNKLIKKFGKEFIGNKVVRYDPVSGFPKLVMPQDVKDEVFTRPPKNTGLGSLYQSYKKWKKNSSKGEHKLWNP